MKNLTRWILILLVLSFACDAKERKRIELTDLPKSNSEFCISDGSSLFIFFKDGRFRSEPLNPIGGRIIEGNWENDPSHDIRLFTITGEWKWINGLFTPRDMREMELFVCSLWDHTTEYKSVFNSEIYQIHDAYLLINRLEKIIESTDEAKSSRSEWLILASGVVFAGILICYFAYRTCKPK
jgi:hypothetical protein